MCDTLGRSCADPCTMWFSTEICQFKISLLLLHKLADWFSWIVICFQYLLWFQTLQRQSNIYKKQNKIRCPQKKIPKNQNQTKTKQKRPKNKQKKNQTKTHKHTEFCFLSQESVISSPDTSQGRSGKSFWKADFLWKVIVLSSVYHNHHLNVAHPAVCRGYTLKPQLLVCTWPHSTCFCTNLHVNMLSVQKIVGRMETKKW